MILNNRQLEKIAKQLENGDYNHSEDAVVELSSYIYLNHNSSEDEAYRLAEMYVLFNGVLSRFKLDSLVGEDTGFIYGARIGEELDLTEWEQVTHTSVSLVNVILFTLESRNSDFLIYKNHNENQLRFLKRVGESYSAV